MGLFNLFGKKTPKKTPQEGKKPRGAEEMVVYSGMRVEVMDANERMLFVAKLLNLHESSADLHQYSELAFDPGDGPVHAKIRGYSDYQRKAVYMEGDIAPAAHKIWAVEKLKISRVANDRAFFRLLTNLDATATVFSGLGIGEKPCKLLNISVGGAAISSAYKYHMGDKFLLKVKLLEDRPVSAIFSQVVRITEKEGRKFEYGCRFLGLTEEDQEKITQDIFVSQRKQRGRL